MAQQHAALRACQELYRIGEIDDTMLASWHLTNNTKHTDESQIDHVNSFKRSKICLELEQEFSSLGLDSSLVDRTPFVEDEDIVCDLIVS